MSWALGYRVHLNIDDLGDLVVAQSKFTFTCNRYFILLNSVRVWRLSLTSAIYVDGFLLRFSLLLFFQVKMPRARSSDNLVTLFYKVKKLESAVSFLQEHGVLHKSVKCTKCLREVVHFNQEKGTGHFFFRCRSCNTKVSVRDNTLLSQGNIGIRTFILLTYLFIMLQGLSIAQKVHEVWQNNLILTLFAIHLWLCLIFCFVLWY